jgi:hypothetical protein
MAIYCSVDENAEKELYKNKYANVGGKYFDPDPAYYINGESVDRVSYVDVLSQTNSDEVRFVVNSIIKEREKDAQ